MRSDIVLFLNREDLSAHQKGRYINQIEYIDFKRDVIYIIERSDLALFVDDDESVKIIKDRESGMEHYFSKYLK